MTKLVATRTSKPTAENKTVNPSSIYCQAVGRAIGQLDQFSLRGPETGADKQNWDEARRLLVAILDRNGYELAGNRIRKRKNQ